MTRWSSTGIGMTITCRTGRISGPRLTCWPKRSHREPWPEPARRVRRAAEALEIGCGLGLAGLVAVARGLRVQFTDYDRAPLDFVVRSAAENGFDPARFSIRQLDWRNLPDEQHSIILGADVIYEARLVPLVAGLLGRMLAPGGVGLDRQPLPCGREGIPGRGRRASG